jgi:hypothetical protein
MQVKFKNDMDTLNSNNAEIINLNQRISIYHIVLTIYIFTLL